jgi:hypothetical protein
LEKNISMLERKHINYTNSLLGHNVSLPQWNGSQIFVRSDLHVQYGAAW